MTTEPLGVARLPEHRHGELSRNNPAREALVYVPAEMREGVGCWSGVWRRGAEDRPACERPGALYVYGQPYCEVHGREVRTGALVELYHHASYDVERLYSAGHVPGMDNRAAVWALTGAVDAGWRAQREPRAILVRVGTHWRSSSQR
jgi:hypothetical protein